MEKREQNLDVLRCLAMMMVVVLHYLSKGGILGDLSEEVLGSVRTAAWIVESLCIVAVNVYMLISGYFLCKSRFKIGRLLGLYGQLWFYSAGVGLICAWIGVVPAEELTLHYYLTILLPVSMGHYWFMTAYLFLYLLLPLVITAANALTQKQLRTVLALLLLAFCLAKSVLPVRLETDAKGYDCLWYLTMFLLGAYIRRFSKAADEAAPKPGGAWKFFLVYVGGCAGVLAEIVVLRAVFLRTGSLGRLLAVSLEYNHIFVVIGAVGLFLAFQRLSVPRWLGRLAGFCAPCTLGVYLLHENIGLRSAWQRLFHADRLAHPGQLLLWTFLAAVSVFALGILTDFVRSRVARLLRGLFLRKERADEAKI